MPSEMIEFSGNIIDSWTLPRTWDVIAQRGGNLIVEDMRVGRSKTDPSYARLKVEADDDQTLELIISELQQFGAVLLQEKDVQTAPVEQNGVLPRNFYSTTNLPTERRLFAREPLIGNQEVKKCHDYLMPVVQKSVHAS